MPRPRLWALPWRLVHLPVCASTETELDRRLEAGAQVPLAVIAHRQTRGHGQQGRHWLSPAGGIWLSAALPWGDSLAARPPASPSLAVSVGLCLQLEQLGLMPRIKWPNDLLLHERKLAGILPRLRWRGGRCQGCCVGLGLNGFNRVPPGAINLEQGLAKLRRSVRAVQHPLLREDRLAALVLQALEWAVRASDQAELVRRQAEHRLWHPPVHWHDDLAWQVEGLALDGSLRLRRGEQLVEVRRHF